MRPWGFCTKALKMFALYMRMESVCVGLLRYIIVDPGEGSTNTRKCHWFASHIESQTKHYIYTVWSKEQTIHVLRFDEVTEYVLAIISTYTWYGAFRLAAAAKIRKASSSNWQNRTTSTSTLCKTSKLFPHLSQSPVLPHRTSFQFFPSAPS